jgi:hypothetical protein
MKQTATTATIAETTTPGRPAAICGFGEGIIDSRDDWRRGPMGEDVGEAVDCAAFARVFGADAGKQPGFQASLSDRQSSDDQHRRARNARR